MLSNNDTTAETGKICLIDIFMSVLEETGVYTMDKVAPELVNNIAKCVYYTVMDRLRVINSSWSVCLSIDDRGWDMDLDKPFMREGESYSLRQVF